MDNWKSKHTFILLGLIISTILLALMMWPQYNIYRKSSSGKAQLEEAKHNRKIQIEEAEAENQAAKSKALTKIEIAKAEAEAEIERARGVAEANRIIGESLQDNDGYIKYLWVTSMRETDKVYVPTEAQIPILEIKP